jgi:hypothetical protein
MAESWKAAASGGSFHQRCCRHFQVILLGLQKRESRHYRRTLSCQSGMYQLPLYRISVSFSMDILEWDPWRQIILCFVKQIVLV